MVVLAFSTLQAFQLATLGIVTQGPLQCIEYQIVANSQSKPSIVTRLFSAEVIFQNLKTILRKYSVTTLLGKSAGRAFVELSGLHLEQFGQSGAYGQNGAFFLFNNNILLKKSS